MRNVILGFVFIAFAIGTQAQKNNTITTFEQINVINNHVEEAKYYYQNNWKVLRDMALEKEYIDSYNLLFSEEGEVPHFILLTSYKDKEQFDSREAHFSELIASLGDLKLLNDLQPSDFRKSVFGSEEMRVL